jgi:chaperonin cofactor prefoldin
MKIEEKTINGIEYIIETHDDGFISKRLKNTGNAEMPKDSLTEIKEKLDFLAAEINTIKKQTEKV